MATPPVSSLREPLPTNDSPHPEHVPTATIPPAPQQTATPSLEELFAKNCSIPENLKPFLPPKVDFFIGRKSELETLRTTLSSSGAAVLIPHEAIPCKIGKSLIARYYASRQTCVYWIPAKNKETLETSYQRLAQQLKLEPSQVKDYLSRQEGLVIFDGVQDSEALQSYLPQGKCHVLITSRKRDWNLPKTEVGALSPEDGAVFLCQATGKQDRETARKISEALDGLPTSLVNAIRILGSEELKAYFNLRDAYLEKHAQKLKIIGNLGSRNPNFTGREMALVALEETLKSGSRAVITGKRKVAAEIGLGGVGKTQIALQYAFRNADKYPFFVWWINCENEATRYSSYAALAERLRILLDDEEKKQENALIKKVNARLERESGWLLIYDNVENQKCIEGLTPKTGGHLLITSRSPDWEIGFIKVFTVDLFKKEESIALIQKVTSLTSEEAGELAELVGNLPLAVAQAAAYIQQTNTSFKEYEQLFKDKSQDLLPSQRPVAIYSKSVNITWALSIEKIKEREKAQAEALAAPYPMAIPLLNFCAFLGSTNIPKDAVLLPWIRLTYRSKETALADLHRTLGLLRDFSIIDQDFDNISIHCIIQLITRNSLNEPTKKEVCKEVERALSSAFLFEEGPRQAEAFKFNGSLVLHADTLVDHMWQLNIELKKTLSLKNRVLLYWKFQGNYARAHSIARQRVEKSQELEEVFQASCIHDLATTLQDKGKNLEAKDCFQKVLKIYEKTLPPEDDRITNTKNNLAITLRALGDYREAKRYYKQVFRVEQRLGNQNNARSPDGFINTYINLGAVYYALKKYRKAKHYFKNARKACEAIQYPANHPTLAGIANNLGDLFNSLGRLEKAEQEYNTALKIKKEIYPANHPAIAKSLTNLATVFEDTSRHQKAEETYKESLEILEKAFPDDSHVDIATTRYNLGATLISLGRPIEAKEQFEKALKIYIKHLPANHPNIKDATDALKIACNSIKE